MYLIKLMKSLKSKSQKGHKQANHLLLIKKTLLLNQLNHNNPNNLYNNYTQKVCQ
jgi:hypothetical protein